MIIQVRFTIQISYNMIKNQKLSNSFLDDQLLTVDRHMPECAVTDNPRMSHVECSTICDVTPVWNV